MLAHVGAGTLAHLQETLGHQDTHGFPQRAFADAQCLGQLGLGGYAFAYRPTLGQQGLAQRVRRAVGQ
jgi:hypothetical protein